MRFCLEMTYRVKSQKKIELTVVISTGLVRGFFFFTPGPLLLTLLSLEVEVLVLFLLARFFFYYEQ